MLRSVKSLEGFGVGATDGTIGHVRDLYFDDQAWVVRYLVVESGDLLSSRKVLVSPIAVRRQGWTDGFLHVAITKRQVKNSPDIDTDKPVSRQHEMQLSSHYDYPYYWGGDGFWGGGMYPNLLMPGYGGFGSIPRTSPEEERASALSDVDRRSSDDPHLRSCRAVMRYHVHASDGDIGHVEGVLIDDETWAVRYLIVGTSNWWLGHQVLVAPQWIQEISWSESKVSVNMTRQQIKDAPDWEPTAPERAQEIRLYDHYRRAGYWLDEKERGAEAARV
jgi:uncharacterized protein YrrD